MNKFKPWQDQLLSVVGLGVQKYGFEIRPKGQSFLKNCPFGRTEFHLAFIKHQDDFDVTANLGIRFDQVEELVNLPGKKADTCTIGCEIGNLSEGRQKRWTIQNANDVPIVGEAIISAFTDIGLPYFERFSDVENVLKVLSGDSRDSWLHSPLDGVRAKRAVGLTLLTHGREAAQSLAKSKASLLEERKDFGLTSFRTFLNKIGLE
jgi:hypothetical protein